MHSGENSNGTGMAGVSDPQHLGEGVSALSLDLLAERIDHERELRETAETASAKALITATDTLERRLEGMNEFRAQLTAQTQTFVSVNVFDARTEAIGMRINTLSERIGVLERQAERNAGSIATWRFLAGGSGVLGVLSLILWILSPK